MLFEHGTSAPSPHADKRLRKVGLLFERGTTTPNPHTDKESN